VADIGKGLGLEVQIPEGKSFVKIIYFNHVDGLKELVPKFVELINGLTSAGRK